MTMMCTVPCCSTPRYIALYCLDFSLWTIGLYRSYASDIVVMTIQYRFWLRHDDIVVYSTVQYSQFTVIQKKCGIFFGEVQLDQQSTQEYSRLCIDVIWIVTYINCDFGVHCIPVRRASIQQKHSHTDWKYTRFSTTRYGIGIEMEQMGSNGIEISYSI